MKNFTRIVGIIVMVAVIGLSTSWASGGTPTVAPASDFEYDLTSDGKGVVIKKYIGSGGNIIVPDTIEGFPVTEVAGVFQQTAVTSVVLPDSVTLFDFFASKQLQTVTFPKGITKIPDACFMYCTALTSITIPDTVTEIGAGVFAESGLTSIVIPEGVTVIGGGAFSRCENLTSLTLPESIQEIGDNVFGNCTSLETVNLPSHQFEIGNGDFASDGAFEGCPKLNIATQKAIRDAGYTGDFVGSGFISRVSEAANTAASGGAPVVAPASDFEYQLTADSKGVSIKKYIGSGGNIIVPDTIEGFPVTVMSETFDNTAVTSVALPDSVTEFIDPDKFNGKSMFTNCAQLQSVAFPKGITEIPQSWFMDCPALTSITIPDTVTEIGSLAFLRTGLTSIVIPEGVTLIDDSVFSQCKNLTSVTLPESIQKISIFVFENCIKLETVNLPSHQFEIGNGAFRGCSKLNLAAQKAILDAGYQDSFK